MVLRILAAASLTIALAGCGATTPSTDSAALATAPDNKPAIAQLELAAGSFGSEQNPVRARMPQGQRAYLDRLRCASGDAPGYRRIGSGGRSPHGGIIDMYSVTCEGSSTVVIWMDMYHEHVEEEPVDGFTIIPSSSV